MADKVEKAPQGESLEEATKKGYIGTTPDDTPNEAYTVGGVTSSDKAAEADRTADRVITRDDVAPADKARKG
jgi:hypothetical protein